MVLKYAGQRRGYSRWQLVYVGKGRPPWSRKEERDEERRQFNATGYRFSASAKQHLENERLRLEKEMRELEQKEQDFKEAQEADLKRFNKQEANKSAFERSMEKLKNSSLPHDLSIFDL